MIETYSPLSPRVKTYQVVADQTPEFAIAENPLLEDFLTQYYVSQDYQGGPVDISENIDKYIKIDNLTKDVISGSTSLASSITTTDDTIIVSTDTKGFPNQWGLLKIGDEVITYTGITTNSFTGCVRGFSGITSYHAPNDVENLQWTDSIAAEHASGSSIQNLSVLFLKEFYDKLKTQYTPGLQGVPLSPTLDVNNFIKEARSLYESKGTNESFKILFKALFGLEPKINDLEKYLIKPSYANYLRRQSFAVQVVSGDPNKLVGETLYQDNEEGNPLVNYASGPISEVVQIRDEYYRISVFIGYDDRDLIQGTFVVPGHTKVIGAVGLGATVITVDSTIGFGQTGTIEVGVSTQTDYQKLEYTEKTINQFIGVTTTSKDIISTKDIYTPTFVYGYEDNDTSKPVNMKITGVLSEFDSLQDLYGLSETSKVNVKNLGRFVTNPLVGKTFEQIFFNSWIYNTSARYQVDDLTGSTFTLAGNIDKSSLRTGDTIELLQRGLETIVASPLTVTYINVSNNSISVAGVFTVTPGYQYDIRRIQEKATSTIVPIVGGQNQILSSVSNTYIVDKKHSESGKKEGYVASNSIPSYEINTDKVHASLVNPTVSGGSWDGYQTLSNKYTIISFTQSVPFRTGEEIAYVPIGNTVAIGGLDADSYFVEVLAQNNKIKLYPSRSFIPSGIAVEFAPPTSSTGIHDFVRVEQARKSIFPGRALKKFILDQDLTKGTQQKTTSERTLDGNTGMLINGVEITNYKSDKYIYYGPLKTLDIVNAGTGYDVLNPPSISIENSSTGINTAYGRLSIGGTVTDVLIDPVDFEIKKVISVDIHGGNGTGAVAQAVTELAYRQFTFNAKSFYNGGNIEHADQNNGRFIMDKPHYYKTGDRVIYQTNNNIAIGLHTSAAAGIDTCLVEGQSYYVGVSSETIFKLYTSKSDSVAGVNTVGFGTTAAVLNTGIHQLRDYYTKRRISRVSMLDSGSGYTNKVISVAPTGVSTHRDFIEVPNHGFKDGEVVHYGISTTAGATAITGLSTDSQYQVLTLNDNKFRLCYSGIATTRIPDKTNYENKEYIRFTSHGVGYQDFSYPPVTVDVNVIADSDKPVTLDANPVVRGEVIDSILYDKGMDYGSNIINFEKAPSVDVNYGSFGQIGLTIVNGRIIDAFVQSRGINYDGPPDLTVTGVGSAFGAKLRAVMDGKEISSVIVLSQGVGYASSTTGVIVKAPGDAATFSTRVRRLVANKVKTSGTLNGDYLTPVEGGLAIESVGYGATVQDAFNDDGSGHSPIIGWAYDGNPIYGPYGLYDTDDIQSAAVRMESSYKLDTTKIYNRPSLSEYEAGFFVEDYYYDSSGDLDEHNGRFCKTPDFEEGIYAYFSTIDNINNPQFPYYIGDTYRGFPLNVNTVSGEKIKQVSFDFENSKLIRNTFPYQMFGDGVAYDFVYQPYKQIPNVATPDKIDIGSIESINIASPGTGYTIGAKLNFDNTDTGGSGATAYVSLLEGQTVNKIDTILEEYNNVVFEWKPNSVIGHFDPSHAFNLEDYVQVAGLSTSVSKLNSSHKISTLNFTSTLLEDGFVGLITDIRVQYIPETVSVGATIGFSTMTPSLVGIGTTVQIGQETAKIINVYKDDSVLRIRRSSGVSTDGIIGLGVSYFADEIEIPLITDKFESAPTKKLYFNAQESVGIGTTVGQTITRNYQYLGVTKVRSLKTQEIYLENHGLQTNDALTFTKAPSGTVLGLKTDGIGNTFNIPSTVYAIRKTENTIGVKTTKTSNDVFFVSGGGDYNDALLEITPDDQVTGSVRKITSTIQTASNHLLKDDDTINLIVQPGLATGIGTTTFATVKIIDDYLIINPFNLGISGINTVTNRITKYKHGLITGDKILFYGSNLPGGISQREYYIIEIDENTFQIANTLKETQGNPNVVDITSVGIGTWSINPINPQLRPFRSNDLIFDMSDPTLVDQDLKFYYDSNFFNEFVGSGTSLGFEIVGVNTTATVGVASTNPNSDGHPTIKVKYSDTSPKVLYYSLFTSAGISTADGTVFNGSQIKYIDSSYTTEYPITSLGDTTFNINLKDKPESFNYKSEDCSILKYTTKSTNTTGGISSIRIDNPGLNYARLPGISSVGDSGLNATLIAESAQVNKLATLTVPDDVYGYPSDNTLKPDAFVPRVVNIDSFATVEEVKVLNGGKFYINAPSLVLYDKATGDIIDSGLITCELSDSAVTSAIVSVPPTGLSNNDFGVAPVRNSNGISIINVSSAAGILTATITTPVLGYVTEPIAIGDKLMIEGIKYDAGSGDGFNSGDYKFIPFEVTDYNDAVNPREVTFDLNGISTNPGTGATVAFGFGQLTQSNFLAEFEVVKGASKFIENEPFKRNNDATADIQLDFIDSNAARIIVSGAEPLEINDILIGKLSGSECRVIGIKEFEGCFEIASSVKTLVGWRDNIGLINDTNQVLPDNDYYQNMSYAIESPKTYEDLITYVNDIVHPSGLKNFANTEVMAKGQPGETNIPAEDAGGLVLDFIGDPVRVDSIYPFDLARDFESQGNISKFVELRSTRLSDFILNKTNRVLNIDDISPKFVSNESNDLSDFRVIATYSAGRYFQRFLTQTVHHAEDPKKNHYQFNEFISVTVDEDTYLLQKNEMKNWDQVGLSTGYATFDTQYSVPLSQTQLIIRPNEPFDTNYEVKSLQSSFSDTPGVGSTNYGHIRLEGGLTKVAAASTITGSVTTNIFGISTTSSQSAIVQLLVIDNPGTNLQKQVDYLEYAIMHDGVDTYLTELATFNSNQNLSGLSNPNFIGTVTSKIEGGLVKFDFENGRSNIVDVKYKSIIVDPSNLGASNYRFKVPFTPDGTERSGRLETTSQAKSGITTVVGITSLTDLSVKSTVHVAYGATQSLHQIYVLSDPEKSQTFISETPLAAIGSTTGVGTFGSTYRPDGTFGIEFHPSVSGIVSITAYNEVLYKDLDPNGTIDGIGDLNYGQVYETVSQQVYLGINNRNVKSFDLNYKGVPIYARETNISNPVELTRDTGVFNQIHFFSNAEQLTYKPDSNLVGIAGSALIYQTGAGVTGYLPETVYAIKDNNQQYRIALTENNAISGTGITFLDGSGAGNKHRFSMRKRDSKSLMSISGLVQKPLSYTSINYDLDVPVNGIVTAFVLNGISSITSGDFLKIEDEYSIVRTVGFGTTSIGPVVGIGTWTIVEVERGAVGSAATAHAAGETARLFRGSFQILDSKIHFAQAPLGGDMGVVNDSNQPYARATFSGRTFLRKDYAKNQVFDDITHKFDGLETTYPLTSIGVAVTGIGSTGGNGILFINNMFQAPYSENNTKSNFKIIDDASVGIASIVFTGISSVGYDTPIIDIGDVNENQLPRGGIIVSLASTPGRGYAPFRGANVRAVTDADGKIIDVVGVPTVGNAVAISTAFYNNETGIMEVSTVGPHNLELSEGVYLNGLQMECIGYKHIFRSAESNALVLGGDYAHTWAGGTATNAVNVQSGAESGNQKSPNSATYDASTGVLELSFASGHGMMSNDTITLDANSLTFTCSRDNHATQHTYPRSTDPISGVTTGITTTSTTSFSLNVGISTLVYADVSDARYDGLTGEMTLSIGSTAVGLVYANNNIIGLATGSITMSCDKDGYATNHAYPRVTDPFHNKTGTATTTADSITINVGKSGLGYGTTIGITSFVYDHVSGIATIIADGDHNFTNPNLVGIATGGLTFTCNQDGYATNHAYPRASDPVNDKFLEIRNVTDNTFDVFVGITTNVGYTPTDATYTPATGILDLVIPNHNFMSGTTAKIKNESLNFGCSMDGFATEHLYPRVTDPVYDTAISVASTTATNVRFNVGSSPLVNYSVTTATYTPSTGFLDLNIGQHALSAQTSIKLATGSLIFRCANDNYISSHAYPRNTIDTQTVNGAVYDANAGIMTVTVVPGGRLIHDGDWIKFDNDSISFKCDMDGGTSTKTYPRSSDPVSGKWLPITGIGTTSFTVNVGKSPIAPYSISSAVYDPTAGIVTATIGEHGFMTGQSIQISPESMSFRCGLDTYQSVHKYPRSSDPGFTTAVSIASTSANAISFQVLASQPSTNISTHHYVPHEGLTAESGTQYDGTVGIMTVTSANHGLSNGDYVMFDTGAVSFTCALDDYSTTHAYPRETDPYSGKWIKVSNVTTNTFRVNSMKSRLKGEHDHIFASGVTGAIKRSQVHGGGAYGHTFQAAGVGSMDQKRDRAYDQPIGIHSVGSTSVTATDAVYDPSAGIMTVTVAGHGFMTNDRVKFDDNSISLKCARDSYRVPHTYPRSSDPISGKWVSIASTTADTFAVDVGSSGPAHQFAHTFDSATTGGIKKQTGYITLQVGVSTDTSVHNYDIGAGYEATNAVVSGGNHTHRFLNATTGAIQYGGSYDHQFVSAGASTLYIDSWSGAALTPTNATYNPATGILQFTAENHGLVNPENFKLAGIGVTCAYGSKTYPSGVQGYYYTVRSVGTTTSFTTFVGVSTLAHPYTGGGTVRVGLTTNIYPDYDQQLDVVGIVSARTFRVNAGISTIPHSYAAGGTAAMYYCELTYGSGYTTDLGTITGIGVYDPGGSPIGYGAEITATVGAGGTLIYNIIDGGIDYSKNTVINSLPPSGEYLSVQGTYREGLGNTTTTGVGASITVDILGITTTYIGLSTGPEFQLSEVSNWTLAKPGYGFRIGDKFGVTGLSTDPDAGDNFIPFEVEVTEIFNDDISMWQFGNLDYIDNIKPFQDGDRKRYPLYYQNQLISFEIDNNDIDSRQIDLAPVLLIFVNGVLQEPYVHYTFNGGTSVSFETPPTVNDDVFIFFYRGTVGADSLLFDVNEVIKEGDSVELFKSAQIELNQVVKDNTNFGQREPRIVTRIATASVVETPFYQGSGVNNTDYKPMRWNKQKVDRVFAGGLVSKARDSMEAQIFPNANVIKSYTDTDTVMHTDHVLNFRDIDNGLIDDFGIYVYGVGIGTTAQAGVNWEYWNDIDPLVTDVQGYTGLVTGITTSAGIGTDLAIVFQLDTNNLVNEENASFVTGFTTGYPFKLYGSGVTPAAGIITSVDTHDSDPIGISTFEVDNIYYAHSVSWDGSARTGVLTCNIHSGTDITGLVGVGSTAHPAARFTWGRFSSALRDAYNPLSLTAKGLDYNPDLDKWPIAQRRNIGLRNTGALDKTL